MAIETPNLEVGSDVPDIEKMTEELQQAQSDSSKYYARMEHARKAWQARWNKQWDDGRKHADEWDDEEANVFPFDGAADGRLRTVAGLIREHVTVAKFAFFSAKVQAKAVRPLVQARESSAATKVLQWQIYTHMKGELNRELGLALAWRFGYGVSLLRVDWLQQRRLAYYEFNLPDLADILQAQGQGDMMLQLADAIMDPAQEDDMTTLVQALSPIVTRPQARKIVQDLRQLRYAKMPVAYPITNRPQWMARRPCIDVLFPSETSDLQQARFVVEREKVSETELNDRIETDNYDPGFVKEAVKHKGEMSGEFMEESHDRAPRKSDRDLIDLYHFYSRAIANGTPCLYKTVFNPLVKGKTRKDPLYAMHGVFEYQHGQYPYVVMRRTHEERPILDTVGIAEEAYTEQDAIKVQQDGLVDRTSLVNRPTMIAPQSRLQALVRGFKPGGSIGARTNEVGWMPLPPADKTPIEVITMVQARMDRLYALFGPEVEEALKQMRRQEVANDVLGEIEQALEMTLQLDQQYLTDDEVKQVAGQLQQPFHASRQEILGKHEISATIDMRMLNEDYFDKKFKAVTAVVQTFNQGGIAKTNQIQRALLELIDPDLADIGLEQDQQVATEKEKNDELQALNSIMNGIEPAKPMFGNHQLRLQTLIGATVQSSNPRMQERLAQNPDSMELLKNRIEFHQNQIQQYSQNPQIGRALSTRTFQPKLAPELEPQV